MTEFGDRPSSFGAAGEPTVAHLAGQLRELRGGVDGINETLRISVVPSLSHIGDQIRHLAIAIGGLDNRVGELERRVTAVEVSRPARHAISLAWLIALLVMSCAGLLGGAVFLASQL